MNKVLILGAGMVARPMVKYFLEKRYRLVIASPMKDRAEEMINGDQLGSAVDWSMDEPDRLDRLMLENDVVVSLLPYSYHAGVARHCLKNLRPLITTSYVQPEMEALNNKAKEAGLLFLNEIGLDPGIDHMSAKSIIDNIHRQGGIVSSFYSLCGALPAPEAADNPLGYKFSWSPRGVLLASLNSALYLKDGKKVFVEPVDLFSDRFTLSFPGVGEFEVYPNRDSLSYVPIYGIPEATTVYRGTLRYKGWCETLDAMKRTGMFDSKPEDFSGMTYSEFMAGRIVSGNKDAGQKTAGMPGISQNSPAVKALEWLGFFSDEKMEYRESTPFEITSGRMIEKMALGDKERDMVIMLHLFMAQYPDGRKEVIRSTLIDYGTPGRDTAIARTVALPAAIAADLILSKKIDLTGVWRPVVPEIYGPVLAELKKLGIEMKEEYGLPLSWMIR